MHEISLDYEKPHILSSFPRSGNHLVRFIVEYVSGCPTKGCTLYDRPVSTNEYHETNILQHVSKDNEYILYKSHDPVECASVIGIVRHYRECIVKYLQYNINHNNSEEIMSAIRRYFTLLYWFKSCTRPTMVLQYETLISHSKNTKYIFNLIIFILTHQKSIPSTLHPQYTQRLDKLLERKEYYFSQCASAKKRHWGGFNSRGMSYYHILRLPYSSRQFFEELCVKYIQNHSQKWQNRIYDTLEHYGYNIGYADYVIVPTGGICNRMRTIVKYWQWVKSVNSSKKQNEVKTRLYVIWRRSEHCRQTFPELFDDTLFCKTRDICIVSCAEHPQIEHINVDEDTSFIHGVQKVTPLHEMYSLYQPIKLLKDKIQNVLPQTPFIAIHIRRTDHSQLAKSKDRFTEDKMFHSFIEKHPDLPIFLATDNRQTQLVFKERYPNRIFWTEDIPEIGHDGKQRRRHHNNEHAAIVDLYTCIKATFFYGSGYSSFSDTIELMRGITNV